MRTSPSIVPHGADQDTYFVLEDFGRIGCAWRETDVEKADRETLIRDLVDGQYCNPVRIVAFNITERWSRDHGHRRRTAPTLRRVRRDTGRRPRVRGC